MRDEAGVNVVWLGSPTFPEAAHTALRDGQLRRNLKHATTTIRDKRLRAVAELDDWETLRLAGSQIKDRVMRHLDE
jgi:L-lactate dehydrogenase complex protein LldF